MQNATRIATQGRRRNGESGFVLVTVLVALGALAGGHLLMMRSTPRPAATEFGLGPRMSASSLYTVTLEPVEPLKTRKMQTVRVRVVDAQGQPVDGATIAVDGGMPQHRHGLPTRPRVTRTFGDGVYEIEGVRFNMGGWWELRLAIDGAAGEDRVTFNLDL